jgi:hypothetical protein
MRLKREGTTVIDLRNRADAILLQRVDKLVQLRVHRKRKLQPLGVGLSSASPNP